MSYHDYLKSKHWKDTRNEALKRGINNNRCRICSSKDNLHIHHKRYTHNGENILGKEKQMHLAILCDKCHGTWHGIYGKRETSMQFIKNARLLYELGASRENSIRFCIQKKLIEEIKNLYIKGTDWRIQEYLGIPKHLENKIDKLIELKNTNT